VVRAEEIKGDFLNGDTLTLTFKGGCVRERERERERERDFTRVCVCVRLFARGCVPLPVPAPAPPPLRHRGRASCLPVLFNSNINDH